MRYRTKRVWYGRAPRLYVEWEGEWRTIKEIARLCGVCYQTAYERIQKGIPVDLTATEALRLGQKTSYLRNPDSMTNSAATQFCQLKFGGG